MSVVSIFTKSEVNSDCILDAPYPSAEPVAWVEWSLVVESGQEPNRCKYPQSDLSRLGQYTNIGLQAVEYGLLVVKVTRMRCSWAQAIFSTFTSVDAESGALTELRLATSQATQSLSVHRGTAVCVSQ